ncbi:MAG: RNA polymerase sigma factor [Acidobacteriota bacterium]
MIDPPATDEELFEVYAPLLLRYFRRNLGKRGTFEDTEDLTQLTLNSIIRSRDTFEGRSSFTTWVYSIAANKLKEFLRSGNTLKRRHDEVSLDLVFDEAEGVEDPHEDPERALQSREKIEQVERCLDQLSRRQREVVLLRSWGQSYSEIAKALGISRDAVKSHLSTGRQRLRRCLDAAESEPTDQDTD